MIKNQLELIHSIEKDNVTPLMVLKMQRDGSLFTVTGFKDYRRD
jgi:hypothetical protein